MKTFVLTLAGSLIALLSASAAPESTASAAKVVDLRIERMSNPETVNHPLPRFGWRIETEEPGYLQTSYRILAASSAELLAQDKGDLWDSGEKPGRNSQFISFGGAPLTTGQVVHWKARCKDRAGKFTAWSNPATFTVKLTGPPALPSPLFPPVSEAPRLSGFECSDPNLNRIYELAAERLHEITRVRDIGLAMRAAAYHQEIHPRASAWLHHMNASVDAAGFYPTTLPSVGTYGATQSDAAISSIHGFWWMTGDRVLLDHYMPTMDVYVSARMRLNQEVPEHTFGRIPPDTLPAGDPTPSGFIQLTSQAYNLRLMLEMGSFSIKTPYAKQAHQSAQNALADELRKTYLDDNGLLKVESLTADLMALRCGLLTDKEKEAISSHAFTLLDGNLNHGTLSQSPFTACNLLPVLNWIDHPESSLKLARSLEPDKLSPLSLASSSEWLISFVAGIGARSEGWQFVMLDPHIAPESELRFAKAHFDGPAGRISSHWWHENGDVMFDVTIPPNTTALIKLPTADPKSISESGSNITSKPQFFSLKQDDHSTSFHALSGRYHFKISR